MRLWTLHPRYLDAKGLVALWREGLLAQRVLQGGTRGYRRHPQLIRFLAAPEPMAAIASYLLAVEAEAGARGYRFNRGLILTPPARDPIQETEGQLLLEWRHLKAKLAVRDPARYRELSRLRRPEPHPLRDPARSREGVGTGAPGVPGGGAAPPMSGAGVERRIG